MNRKQMIGAAVIAAVAFAAGLVMRGERMARAAGPDRAATIEPPLATKPPASRNDAIAELTAIVKETESIDTFLLTLQTLARQNPLDKSLVPLAIRKAEKLGLIDGAMFNPKPQQQVFMQLLDHLQGTGAGVAGGCPPGCAPVGPYGVPACPPGCAPTVTPLYGPPPVPDPPAPLAVPTPAAPER